jgi:hypothetical protein
MIILSIFDYSGNMMKPWKKAGYETLTVDVQHSLRVPQPGQLHCDLSTLGPLLVGLKRAGVGLDDIGFLSCFPPCTDVAVSGTRDHPMKGLRALGHSCSLFATCIELAELLDVPWMIENPVSTMSTYWRKPDHTFHPWDYAGHEPKDNYVKKTCLWTGGGFVMPPPNTGGRFPDDRIHKASPGPQRANLRSATPMGFARAVFETNEPKGPF